MPKTFRRSLLGVLLVLSLGATSCSTFHREWDRAADVPPPATGLQGRWEGSWLSDVNGHNGRLRCLISAQPDGMFQARFHAKYWKIFSFGYTVMLRAEPADGRYQFEGQADLGRLAGGLYRYEGHVERTNFFATYACKYDHGTFQMSRPVSSGRN